MFSVGAMAQNIVLPEQSTIKGSIEKNVPTITVDAFGNGHIILNDKTTIYGNSYTSGHATFGQTAIFQSGATMNGTKLTGIRADYSDGNSAVNVNQLFTVRDNLRAETNLVQSNLNATNLRVTATEGDIVNLQNTKADKADLVALETKVTSEITRLDKDIASLEDRKADKKQVTADIATAKSEAISIANTYTDKAEKRLTDRVDAVGRQLDDLRVDLGNETTRAMTAEMNITNEMRGLGAMTAAMVSAQGSQLYSPTKRGNVSIGTGYYRGATAVSAGVSYFTSSNTKINTNIATGTHIKLAVGIGASFGF
jgi:hypothetical protein